MGTKVDLFWERTATVYEKGGCSVIVDDPNDEEEIARKFKERDFYEFLTTQRTYGPGETMTFERLNDNENN